MAHATADIGMTEYAVSLLAGHHRLMSDEGAAIGGKDAGPAPHELLCAALDETQRARLADIAERTPVTLTLKQGVSITTILE